MKNCEIQLTNGTKGTLMNVMFVPIIKLKDISYQFDL